MTRLLRYPCSYLVYSEAFDGLTPAVKAAAYRRIFEILSGRDRSPRYAHLSAADRLAVAEILRATKVDIPGDLEAGATLGPPEAAGGGRKPRRP